ncbi:hypothetical protein WJX72_008983 [[Myrmecia] bisecta]|uniref:Ribosome biogenesis protein BOP1 homolog n=1 Tax=[Myrmecia] bisecta TaxID=41462 RepID=A0AAW1R8V0_9CHLO
MGSKRNARAETKLVEQAEASSDSELDAEELYLSSDDDADAAVGPAPEDGSTSDDADDESEEGSEQDSEEEGGSLDDELDRAVVDYIADRGGTDDPAETSGRPPGEPGEAEVAETRPVDPGSDSSEDERPNRNTIGNVPLQWYKDEEHIGYDKEGSKLIKRERRDRLDALLARNDSGKEWRTVYDEYNDEEIVLSKEEMQLIQRIRAGQFPHIEVNPYEPEVDWFTRETEIHPLSSAPEPKRRFIPSKWEEKKVVKLVRALRKGWIKREKKDESEEPPAYLLWQDDGMVAEKTATGLSYIPAPKPKLPTHEESYNPPKEYLPTEEERAAYELQEEEDRPQFLPQAFDSLRKVPMYSNFIQERFERCLDLYLCPRTRRKRFDIDPESLVPKLPKPRDLQPFPSALMLRFRGHKGKVLSISVDPTGQWLASGSSDGSLKLWEVRTARCMHTWALGGPVHCTAWCPNNALRILAAVVDKKVVLLPSGTGTEEVEAAAVQALKLTPAASEGDSKLAHWQARDDGQGVDIVHQHLVKSVTWHGRGDYFASVAPTGNTQAVLVHQLSKQATQNPFRKNRGRVVRVAFHPAKPFFFVATQNHVRIYNLAKQALAKKLIAGGGITSLAVHPTGDHVIVGSEDKRLAWYDLDLSAKPYKALRYHTYALRSVAYHRSYPLFASSSDDGSVHVFHGMVYQDLLTNPLIVPVKILRGHERVDHEGVLDCAFHPTQPWIFTAGADGDVCLFCN